MPTSVWTGLTPARTGTRSGRPSSFLRALPTPSSLFPSGRTRARATPRATSRSNRCRAGHERRQGRPRAGPGHKGDSMFTIAGATGHVGSAVATKLLQSGAKIRVIVRSKEKGERFAEGGAEVAIGNLEDAQF